MSHDSILRKCLVKTFKQIEKCRKAMLGCPAQHYRAKDCNDCLSEISRLERMIEKHLPNEILKGE